MKKMLMISLLILIGHNSTKATIDKTYWENKGVTQLDYSISGTLFLDFNNNNPTMPTQLTMTTGGRVTYNLDCRGNSTVIMKGTSSIGHAFNPKNNSIVTMTENSSTQKLVGQSNSRVTLLENATVHDSLWMDNTSVASLFDNVTVNDFVIIDNAEIHIYGTNFFANGLPISDGDDLKTAIGTSNPNGYGDYYGTLTRTLKNGSVVTNNFQIQDRGYHTSIGNIYVHVVPEPLSLSLLTIGAFTTLKRRHKRSNNM